MSLFASLRNAVQWAGFDLGRTDGASAQAVVLVNPVTGSAYAASSSEVDRELIVTTYRVKTAFTGASVGDTVTATQVIDVSGAPVTVSTVWRNQTTSADFVSVPSAANLELLGSQAITDAQLRAAAVATEPLGAPGVSRPLAVTASSNSVALTATCRRVSIKARGCDMRYVIGVGAQTANAATSHFIEAGERLDLAVPAGATIAAIRETAATSNGSLAITELV